MDKIDEFKTFLKNLPSDGLNTTENEYKITSYLWDIWPLLSGSGFTSMRGDKLYRAENILFIPPDIITFEIERHGQTVMGSVYATLYEWTINLSNRSAEFREKKKRVVGNRAKPLKVEPLAEVIANHIFSLDRTAEKLKWISDKKVRVLIGDIIPATYQQTTASRRKRFRDKLEALLRSEG